MRIRTLSAALCLVLMTLGATVAPATAASSTTGSTTPYCRYTITTGSLQCASTEAKLQSLVSSSVAPLATSYLLGRFYDDINRTGPYLDIFASGPCDTNSDVDWSVANIGATWNDRVTSFQGYSACEIRVYENENYGGATYGAFASTNYVGDAMNDRTTSMRFY